MTRSILIFIAVFAASFAASFVWVQRGKWLAALQGAVPQFKAVAQVVSPDPVPREDLVPKVDVPPTRDFAPQIELPKIELPKISEPEKMQEPAAPKPRLLLNRWPMPRGTQDPEKLEGISMFVDPSGPSVVTQSKAGTLAWDAVTGRTRRVPKMEQAVTIKHLLVDGKAVAQIRDRRTKQILLEVKESPARAACLTPDGKRLIVVGRPSDYPRYQTVNPMKGVTWHDEKVFKNIRVFDIASSQMLGEFGPRNHGMDDESWAVATSPDGKSFFFLTKRNLFQVSFESAFGVAPLPPREL